MEPNQLWGMCWMSIRKGKEDKWPLNVTGKKQFTRVCEGHILSEAGAYYIFSKLPKVHRTTDPYPFPLYVKPLCALDSRMPTMY